MGSPADGAFCVDVQRIQRLTCRHEQPVASCAAKADIRGAFGQRDAADHCAVGREHRDTVEFGAHSPAAPQIAIDIAAEAIGRALTEIGEIAAVAQRCAVIGDIEDANNCKPGDVIEDIWASNATSRVGSRSTRSITLP